MDYRLIKLLIAIRNVGLSQLAHAKYRTCGTFPGKIHHHPTKTSNVAKAPNSSYEANSDNWAGNVDMGNRATYHEAEVTFTVPNEVPGESTRMGTGANIGDDVTNWAGVGGDNSVTKPAVVYSELGLISRNGLAFHSLMNCGGRYTPILIFLWSKIYLCAV